MKIVKITINDFYMEWKTNPENKKEIDVDVWKDGVRIFWGTYPKVRGHGLEKNAFYWLNTAIIDAKREIVDIKS